MNNGQPQSESALDHPALDDATLVRRFVNCRDQDAFAELVRRYRGLVYGVAQRVLSHRQDAEDVFQATFLVLARDAADIRLRASVASWLYGVAHRTALRARARRPADRDSPLKDDTMDHANPFAEVARRSDLQSLDEELNALSERDREPLVLRYLMGRSNKQIAEELGLTEAAVESRLKRGRERLRKRLARRGIGLTAVVAAMEFCRQSAEAAAPDALVEGTVEACLNYTSAGPSQPLYSQSAANLAAKEVSTMTTSSFGTIGALTLATTVLVAVAFGLSGSDDYVSGASDNAQVLQLSTNQRNRKRDDVPIRVAKGKKPSPMGTGVPGLGVGVPGGVAPKTLDLGKRSKVEAKLDAVEDVGELAIIDETLEAAMTKFATLFKVKIIILNKVLVNDGVNTHKLINHQLSGISMHSALNIILSEFEPKLTYIVEDEVVKITTVTDAEERLETRVYDTRALMHLDPHELEKVIHSTTRGPWSDDPAGGAGIGGTIEPVPGGLVVRQNYHNHREIRELLQKLARQPAVSGEELKRFEEKSREVKKVTEQKKQTQREQRLEALLRRLELLLKKLADDKKPTPGEGSGGGFF